MRTITPHRSRFVSLVVALAAGCAAPGAGQPPALPPPTATDAAQAGQTPGPAADPSSPPAEDPKPISPEAVDGESGDPDDGVEGMPEDAPPSTQPRPKVTLSGAQIAERMRRDPTSVGSLSVGLPSAGALINGSAMPRDSHWELTDPGNAWGTRETIDMLTRAIERVRELSRGTPALPIGHISAKRGGPLSPHKSHQSGRDVDIGYFHTGEPRHQFINATSENLDARRTWIFVRTLVKETDVEMIFIDTSIQKLLAAHAESLGEDAGLLDAIFQSRGKSATPIVRYARGHLNHLHIRFFNPLAQELGKRAHPYLQKTGAAPPVSYTLHKVRNGDLLMWLATHYGTTVEAIQQANGLRGTGLKIGQVLKIPSKGAPKARR